MTKERKLTIISIVLSVIGLIDALYLAVIKFSNQKALCIQGIGDCWTVNISSYSEILGVPISVFGAIVYLVILFLLLFENKTPLLQEYSKQIVMGLSLAGTLYSAYLTYLEIFVIKAICPFCVLSALVMVSLLGVSIARLATDQVELYTSEGD